MATQRAWWVDQILSGRTFQQVKDDFIKKYGNYGDDVQRKILHCFSGVQVDSFPASDWSVASKP